ncbi:hypothetical protein ACP6NG_18160 [Brevibacterium casei]|uniref:hypothetical protein n=1 Tax=Brevibacterium casei TaxID=33889 RepID=UPI003F7E9652
MKLVKLLEGTGESVEAEQISGLSKHLVKAHSRKMAARRGRERPPSEEVSGIEEVSWEDILTEAGWSYLRTDYDGRDLWVRPGSSQKSAAVNWPENPDVMSLLSDSPATGLFDLKEAGIPLTKYRVALRLIAGDEPAKLVSWVS